jgi:hypothetical protein
LLRPRWEGPFTVVALAGPNTYTLTLPRRFKCSPTVNVDRLKPFYSRADRPPGRPTRRAPGRSATWGRKASTLSSSCSTARRGAVGPTTWCAGRVTPRRRIRGSRWSISRTAPSASPSTRRQPLSAAATQGPAGPATGPWTPSAGGAAPPGTGTAGPAPAGSSAGLGRGGRAQAGPLGRARGAAILYWWPDEGWQLGRVRRLSRTDPFTHVVGYRSPSAAFTCDVTVDSEALLDSDAVRGSRWVALTPGRS